MIDHSTQYVKEVIEIAKKLDLAKIDHLANEILKIRVNSGRLFIVGVGGSAANASHAVNDFRKLCGIDALAPTDNIAEITARTNDEGFETIFSDYLRVSKNSSKDGLLIFSVGGGNLEKNVSVNLINVINQARKNKTKVFGIVGKDDGYTAQNADLAILIPNVNQENVTPHSESFQGIIWHCLVSNPKLKIFPTKW
jgi:D-sedoheptulose 7-phosphate isomerase